VQVTSVNHTPNAELTIVAAARSSVSQSTFEELWHKLSHTQIYDLPEQQLDSDHLSTFEHVNFTFDIHGISRVSSDQLVRHRLTSYTQQSQRCPLHHPLGYQNPACHDHKRQGITSRLHIKAALATSIGDFGAP